MKKIFLVLSVAMLFMTACSKDEPNGSKNKGMDGWYYLKDYKIATTADFTKINNAIRDHTQLSQSYVSHGNTYGEDIYATYDLLFDDEGWGPYFAVDGRKLGYQVLELENNASYAIHLLQVSEGRIKYYYCTLGNDVMGKKTGYPALHKVYAGQYLGTLAYYGEMYYDLSYSMIDGTLVTIDNQHVFSYEDGHLYEITSSGKEYIRFTPNQ